MIDAILTILVLALLGLILIPSSPPVLKFLGSPGARLTYYVFRSRYPALTLSLLLFAGLLIRAWTGAADPRWAWGTGIVLGLALLYFFSLYQPNLFRPLKQVSRLSAEAADRLLAPTEEVLGVVINGEARAIPTEMLNRAHAVTDMIGHTPVAVTYCVLCHSAIGFEAEIDGSPLDLVLAANYYNNVVFYDRTRRNLIQQMGGEVIYGPDRGRGLPLVPVTITNWQRWRQAYPDTKVLLAPPRSWFDRMVRQALARIDVKLRQVENPFYTLRDKLDRRIFTKELVLGIAIGDVSKAYPLSLISRFRVINDEVGGQPIVILSDAEGELTDVFYRTLAEQTLRLEPVMGHGDVVARDDDGSLWDIRGRARQGPRAGAQLQPVAHFNKVFWFSWALFHPGTTLVTEDDLRRAVSKTP